VQQGKTGASAGFSAESVLLDFQAFDFYLIF